MIRSLLLLSCMAVSLQAFAQSDEPVSLIVNGQTTVGSTASRAAAEEAAELSLKIAEFQRAADQYVQSVKSLYSLATSGTDAAAINRIAVVVANDERRMDGIGKKILNQRYANLGEKEGFMPSLKKYIETVRSQAGQETATHALKVHYPLDSAWEDNEKIVGVLKSEKYALKADLETKFLDPAIQKYLGSSNPVPVILEKRMRALKRVDTGLKIAAGTAVVIAAYQIFKWVTGSDSPAHSAESSGLDSGGGQDSGMAQQLESEVQEKNQSTKTAVTKVQRE